MNNSLNDYQKYIEECRDFISKEFNYSTIIKNSTLYIINPKITDDFKSLINLMKMNSILMFDKSFCINLKKE